MAKKKGREDNEKRGEYKLLKDPVFWLSIVVTMLLSGMLGYAIHHDNVTTMNCSSTSPESFNDILKVFAVLLVGAGIALHGFAPFKLVDVRISKQYIDDYSNDKDEEEKEDAKSHRKS